MSISVIVIALNEEAAIGRCLASVGWTDEIVVVDSGSTDRTVELSRAAGAKVAIAPDWPGFGPQKNRALDLATGDWVLSLDADEWVSPALAAEIRAVAAQVNAFHILHDQIVDIPFLIEFVDLNDIGMV